jgi:polyisoprenoid-binding protein YceI
MAIRMGGFVFALVLAASTAALGSDVYQIDPAHTDVGFSVRHMVINNVKGSFKEFSGMIEYDGKDPLTIKASGTIKAASIDTAMPARDEHLRSPDFFDVAKFPEIAFQSERVEKLGDGYALVGKFTMHGVTKEVSLPFTISGPIVDPYGKSRIGIETSLTLNRKDYGVNWSKTLDNGGLVVADEVKIEIGAEAVRQEAEAAAKK